ncbi:unnamed protein product [Lampetra planeri]
MQQRALSRVLPAHPPATFRFHAPVNVAEAEPKRRTCVSQRPPVGVSCRIQLKPPATSAERRGRRAPSRSERADVHQHSRSVPNGSDLRCWETPRVVLALLITARSCHHDLAGTDDVSRFWGAAWMLAAGIAARGQRCTVRAAACPGDGRNKQKKGHASVLQIRGFCGKKRRQPVQKKRLLSRQICITIQRRAHGDTPGPVRRVPVPRDAGDNRRRRADVSPLRARVGGCTSRAADIDRRP